MTHNILAQINSRFQVCGRNRNRVINCYANWLAKTQISYAI